MQRGLGENRIQTPYWRGRDGADSGDDAIQGSGVASSVAGTGGVVAVWPFTATHFSFLPFSTSSFFSPSSSSEVTLSSVSASTPVVVSDSELEELEDDDSEVEVVAAAAGAVSVDVVSTPGVEVLLVVASFAAASFSLSCLRSFARASLRSSFWNKELVRWARHSEARSHLLSFLFFLLSNQDQHQHRQGKVNYVNTSFASFSSFCNTKAHQPPNRMTMNLMPRTYLFLGLLFGFLLFFGFTLYRKKNKNFIMIS